LPAYQYRFSTLIYYSVFHLSFRHCHFPSFTSGFDGGILPPGGREERSGSRTLMAKPGLAGKIAAIRHHCWLSSVFDNAFGYFFSSKYASWMRDRTLRIIAAHAVRWSLEGRES
jgi:hypothetical protein